MYDTLDARLGLQVLEVMYPLRSQAMTATIVMGEDTRITTTIFTSQDIVHDLLVLSNEVMRKMGIL